MERGAGWTLLRLLLLFLLGSHCYRGLFYKRGWVDLREMLHRNQMLEKKIEEVRIKKSALEKKIQAIQSSSLEQERMVRKVLGYVRKSETVIEFD